MARRFYRVELRQKNSVPTDVNLKYVVSADLDGLPAKIWSHMGYRRDVVDTGVRAGANDELEAVLAKHYAPLRVMSVEEFIFGVVWISRYDMLIHLMELDVISEPSRLTEEDIRNGPDRMLDDVLKPDILSFLNKYIAIYADTLCRNIHKEGIRVQTHTLDAQFVEEGFPSHPAYPYPFVPPFFQNLLNKDLSEEYLHLDDVTARSARAAFDEVFGPMIERTPTAVNSMQKEGKKKK